MQQAYLRLSLAITATALTVVGLGLAYVVTTSYGLSARSTELRAAATQSAYRSGDLDALRLAARQRFLLYDQLLTQGHLQRGLVVDRHIDGAPGSICDSLLFSSLRYVALKRMGFHDRARRAWTAIEASQDGGRWFRHPDCADQSTSRDMILGVLASLINEPPNADAHLANFLNVVDSGDGYFSHGPFYVSYLSPGLADIVRRMALARGWRNTDLPDHFRAGFSTLALDAWASERGYVSHLVGLTTFIELELDQQVPLRARGLIDNIGPYSDLWTADPVASQRLQWVSEVLVNVDEANLFFRYLWHRTHNALTPGVRAALLDELLAMPQFPKDRLPQDCDRYADYLWQRDSDEYRPRRTECSRTFSGVDFLWMVALLDAEPQRVAPAWVH